MMDTKTDFEYYSNTNTATVVAGVNSTETYLDAWEQLLRYSKALEQEMGNRFRKQFKQSLSRFDLLAQLSQRDPDWMPIGKLAKQLPGSNGNITGLVDRMIGEGLIHRRNSPADRRSIEVGLTDKGRELHGDMASAHADWTESLMDECLPVKDAEQLVTMLGRANQAFY